MAQTYDGSIRINTEIDTRNVNSQMLRLINEIKRTSKEISDLKSKMDILAKTNVPTAEYKQMQTELQRAEAYADKLYGKLRVMEKSGDTTSAGYARLVNQIKIADQQVDSLREGVASLEASGKAYTPGANTAEYAKMGQQVDNLNKKLEVSNLRLKEMNQKQRTSEKSFGRINKSANKTRMSFARMLGMSVAFSAVFRAISAITSGVGTGFTNLMGYSNQFAETVQSLKNALSTLGNAFAAAFAPIISIVIPALNSLIGAMTTAMTYVAQFIAVLGGNSTFLRAKKIQDSYADSLDGTAAAAKKATGALAKFDDLDVLQKQEDSGGAGGTDPSNMFEEASIPENSNIKKFAEQVKAVLAQIFTPFREAWEAEGQATIDSVKYALSSILELAKSVGSSLLEVWTNGTGTQMLTTMLQIAQSVLNTIGNIATRLSEAWNTNNVGTQIIQGLANALQEVLNFINRIAGATANWAANLNFYPLLESINNLIQPLAPIVEKIGDFLADLYENIILPIGTALIETIIPGIINVASKLLNFLAENQWIIEAVGYALLGAFAASKIVPAITTIIGIVTQVIGVIQTVVAALGAGGLGGAISAIVSALGGPLTLAIAAIIAVGAFLITHWEEVKAVAASLADWIVEKWNIIKDFTSETWNNIRDTLSDVWNTITTTAKTIWTKIQTTISTIWNTLKTTATTVFNGIKTTISNVWNAVKTTTTNIWNGIKNTIKSVINSIIGSINGMINGIVSGINAVINALNSLHFDIPSWVPVLGGKSFGFSIPNISAPQIPYLASGAVIRGGDPFLAVLGDQPSSQTNVEAPLSTIEQALENVMNRRGDTSGGISPTISLNVNGQEFARLTLGDILREMRTQGYDVDVLGVT